MPSFFECDNSFFSEDKAQGNFQDEGTIKKRKAEQSHSKKKQKKVKLTEEFLSSCDKEEESINDIDDKTGEEENVLKPRAKKKRSRVWDYSGLI